MIYLSTNYLILFYLFSYIFFLFYFYSKYNPFRINYFRKKKYIYILKFIIFNKKLNIFLIILLTLYYHSFFIYLFIYLR